MMADGFTLPWWRRIALPLTLAVSLLLLTQYYVTETPKLEALRQGGNLYLLGAGQKPTQAAVTRLSATIPAVSAEPLSQQVVNGVIAARAQTSGNIARARREAMLLRQLGWRSTSALQNLLWIGGTTQNMPLIMDTLDGLLRRQKLLSSIYPVLNLMSVYPEFRTLLIDRVKRRPPWRYYYFMSASDLKKPEEIMGRYEVMRAVQRGGDRLTRNEIAPILPRLIAINRGPEAFSLWRTHLGKLTSPLTDSDFAVATQPLPGDALPISFEWQLGNGSGYFADASRDAQGSFLSIDWSGRGAPVFVSQVTSAVPGRYRLLVLGDSGVGGLADRVGFRLTCSDGQSVVFAPIGKASDRRVQLETTRRLPCAFPTLELYGLVQSGMAPGDLMLRSIQMTRVGA